MGGPRITMTYIRSSVSRFPTDSEDRVLTEGIKWMIRPGKGDFPVGQFDAQNLLPNGRGIPSLASSVGTEATSNTKRHVCLPWLTREAANVCPHL